MNKKELHIKVYRVLLVLLASVLISLVLYDGYLLWKIVSHMPSVYIGDATNFPPSYTPPTEIPGCYTYDIGKGYDWEKPPYGGEHVIYEKGWSGQAHRVLTFDVDEAGIPRIKLIFLMRESFGMGCPANQTKSG